MVMPNLTADKVDPVFDPRHKRGRDRDDQVFLRIEPLFCE